MRVVVPGRGREEGVEARGPSRPPAYKRGGWVGGWVGKGDKRERTGRLLWKQFILPPTHTPIKSSRSFRLP